MGEDRNLELCLAPYSRSFQAYAGHLTPTCVVDLATLSDLTGG
jgi:hypothetical protein